MKHIPGKVKFLVCVDSSEECKVALKFACMRAKNSGGEVVLLYVIEFSLTSTKPNNTSPIGTIRFKVIFLCSFQAFIAP